MSVSGYDIIARPQALQRIDDAARRGVVWLVAPAGSGKSTLVAAYARGRLCVWIDLAAHDVVQRLADVDGLVVLDNYERLPAGSPMHAVLAAAFERVSNQCTVIVSSRVPPPADYSRLRVHGRLTCLGWPELRLSDDEALAIVSARLGRAPSTAEREALATWDGWAAGLVMTDDTALFDYLAREVLEGMPASLREVLFDTAFLPVVRAGSAARISGQPDAERWLSELAESGWYAKRRDEGVEYHLLFKAFLIERGELERGRERSDEARRRCRLEVGALIRERAPALLDSGRIGTVGEWLALLSEADVAADPWLLTWRAAASLPRDEVASLRDFARAFEMFSGSDDATGAYWTCAGAIESQLLRWRHGAPLDLWLERLDDLAARFPEVPTLELETRVAASGFTALFWRRPAHPDLDRWHRRARAAFERTPGVAGRLAVGPALIHHSLMRKGDVSSAQAMLDSVGPLPDGVVPLVPRLMWGYVDALTQWLAGDAERALTLTRAGLAEVDRGGLELVRDTVGAPLVYTLLSLGDHAAARAELEARKPVTSAHERCHREYQLAWIALGEGAPGKAVEHCLLGLALVPESDSGWPIWGLRIALAQARLELGEFDAGLAILTEVDAHPYSRGNPLYLVHRQALSAWLALRAGDFDVAEANLVKLLTSLGERRVRLMPLIGWRRPLLRELLLFALDRGIVEGVTRDLIAAHRMHDEPPSATVERWPWAVRISTLGGLSIVVGDAVVKPSRKAPAKPLELLKALVALGVDGTPVSEARLSDALWPDSDAVAGTLRTTLHRLRRLIGVDTVRVVAGALMLDPRACWLDVRAFEGQLAKGDVAAVLALYRGPFLPDEQGFWAIALRARLSRAFVRWAATTAESWVASGRATEAVDLLVAALTRDEGEPLHHGLIAAYLALGRHADAIAAYRRCEAALAHHTGGTPSAATRALYQRVINEA